MKPTKKKNVPERSEQMLQDNKERQKGKKILEGKETERSRKIQRTGH